MVDVAARHEHSRRFKFDIVTAHGAAGRLKLTSLSLAMLFHNLDDKKLLNRRFLGLFGALPRLGLLLTHTPDRLENVIRREVRLEVAHETVGVEPAVGCLHIDQLPTVEHIHKIAHDVVD